MLDMSTRDDASTKLIETMPPRYWWLKRLSLAFVLLLLAVLGLRFYAVAHLQSQIDTQVQAIADRGEPIYFDDMRQDPVPDAENKFHFVTLALQQWPMVKAMKAPGYYWSPEDGVDQLQIKPMLITDSAWYQDAEDYPDIFADPITDNAAYLKQLEPVFELLRQAEAAPRVDHHLQLTDNPLDILLPHLGNTRKMARLLKDATERAIAMDDDDLALELIRLQWTIADALSGKPSMLIGHLVYLSIDSVARASILESLHQLDISNSPEDPARLMFEQLIAQLLDEQVIHRSLIEAYMTERWSMYNTINNALNKSNKLYSFYTHSPAKPTFFTSVMAWVFKPLVLYDQSFVIEQNNKLVDIVRPYPLNHDIYDQLHEMQNDFDDQIETTPFKHMLSDMIFPALFVSARTHLQAVIDRRLTAVAMAARLYQIDHGQLPDRLEDLVPDYLSAVPTDPMSPAGQPLQYKPDGGVWLSEDHTWYYDHGSDPSLGPTPKPTGGPAIVYSLGQDQRDDGGLMFFFEDGQYDDLARMRQGDHWIALEPIDPKKFKHQIEDEWED